VNQALKRQAKVAYLEKARENSKPKKRRKRKAEKLRKMQEKCQEEEKE